MVVPRRDTSGNRREEDAFSCVKSLSNELEQLPIEAQSPRFTGQRIHGFAHNLRSKFMKLDPPAVEVTTPHKIQSGLGAQRRAKNLTERMP